MINYTYKIAQLTDIPVIVSLANRIWKQTYRGIISEEQIDYTIKAITETVLKLREMSPLWEMYKEGADMNTVEWQAH